MITGNFQKHNFSCVGDLLLDIMAAKGNILNTCFNVNHSLSILYIL